MRTHGAEFKVTVALVAVRGARALAGLAAGSQAHRRQSTAWKEQALAVLLEVVSRRRMQRQLRATDRMAKGDDLEGLKGAMPRTA